MASPSKGLALVLKEIALDEAGQTGGFETLTHIPGVSNTLADPCPEFTHRMQKRSLRY